MQLTPPQNVGIPHWSNSPHYAGTYLLHLHQAVVPGYGNSASAVIDQVSFGEHDMQTMLSRYAFVGLGPAIYDILGLLSCL
jgi:hypothetical protein